jgi:flagellar FliL protein
LGQMATEAAIDDGAAEPAEKPKGKRKLIIIIAAAAVLLLGGGAAAYFFLFAGAPVEEDHAAVEVPHTFIFNLPAMTVNLQSEGDGEPAFMKLTIALEVADEEVMTAIQPRLAKVVDAFQVYLRELRKSDLEGSAGIYRLKEELRRRINVAVYPDQVESILFKEILVQ